MVLFALGGIGFMAASSWVVWNRLILGRYDLAPGVVVLNRTEIETALRLSATLTALAWALCGLLCFISAFLSLCRRWLTIAVLTVGILLLGLCGLRFPAWIKPPPAVRMTQKGFMGSSSRP